VVDIELIENGVQVKLIKNVDFVVEYNDTGDVFQIKYTTNTHSIKEEDNLSDYYQLKLNLGDD
jgi:hypothetical protein